MRTPVDDAVTELLLRNARPRRGLLGRAITVSGKQDFVFSECDVPPETWEQEFAQEGFDPNCPWGPVYWRIPQDGRHYYSMMLKNGELVFVITATNPSAN